MKNLFKALSKFQQEVPVILKDTEGYGYKYAELSQILNIINPLLKINGLGFSQPINGNSIKTIIYHIESGEILESETLIPENVSLKGMNDFQVLGSAITYLRRYALSSILGLVTDKDVDGGGEQMKKEVKPIIRNNEKVEKKELKILGKYKTFTVQWSNILDAISNGKINSIEDVEKHYTFDSYVKIKIQELLKSKI